MEVANRHFLTHLDPAAVDATDADAPDVIVIVNRRNEQLQVSVLIAFGGGNVIKDLFKQRGQILAGDVRVFRSRARATRAIEHRGIELFVVGAEVHEQFEDLVLNFAEPRVGLVDLVDADDDPMIERECPLQNKSRLGHRSLGGVNQEDNAVDHFENALDFSAEIGVAGGVDDVDFHVLVVDGGVFCKDGDAALALEVARVHDAGHGLLVLAIDASLFEKTVHKRGFSVVNVRDDRHVAKIVSYHCILRRVQKISKSNIV